MRIFTWVLAAAVAGFVLRPGSAVAGGVETIARAAPGDLAVTVVLGGQPRASATVCVGTAENPRQYGQRTTNASGVAVFENLPHGLVLVTAQAGLFGASETRGRNRFGQYYETMTITLPLSPGGPTCGSGVLHGGDEPVVTNPNPRQVTPPTADRDLRTGVTGPVTPKVEYCFGALGAQCGGAQDGLPVAALCAAGRCQINAGSWEHDECCFANPNGMACRVGPADAVLGHDGRCVNEWNKALTRLSAGLNWGRPVDFSRPNSTGRVEFNLYCAPSGTRVHQDDVRYCCSRQGDPVEPVTTSRLDRTNYAVLRRCR